MRKILLTGVSILSLFASILVAEAARIGTSRPAEYDFWNPSAPTYQAPTVVTPIYQQPTYYSPYQPSYIPPTASNTPPTASSANNYLYSQSYQQGYTYYSTPVPGYYYYYSGTPIVVGGIERGQYYYSQNYQPGYTYYSTPTAGYYYYLPRQNISTPTYPTQPTYPSNPNPNTSCRVINGYYQCVNIPTLETYASYPGCSAPDILIGGQIWASCNAVARASGSDSISGWFYFGDSTPSFAGYNSTLPAYEIQGHKGTQSTYTTGPCAPGYRIPSRGDWETAIEYARANRTSLSSMLSLPLNGGYIGRTSLHSNSITARVGVRASYWSSTTDSIYGQTTPFAIHIADTTSGYTLDGSFPSSNQRWYQWITGNEGLTLESGQYKELANVRCIKQ